MQKTTGIILIIFMVLGFLSIDLEAQTKFKVKVVTEQANIRIKPDIGSEMLLQVPEGTELEAEKKEGEWFLVIFEKADGTRARGYVHESLVEVVAGEKPVVLKKGEPVRKEIKPELQARAETKIKEPSTSRPKFRPGYGLAIFGGGAYVSPSDLNRGARGVAEYYLYKFHSSGSVKMTNLHLTYLYGLDLYCRLNDQIFLGLGFDYFQGAGKNQKDFVYVGSSYSVITEPKIKDLPLRFSLFYQPVNYFYARLGMEVHLARASYLYRITEDESWMEWRGKASALGLGWMEAVGLQWPITSWCRIFAEGSYRYVKIKNLEGKNHYSDSSGSDEIEKGKLYYWEVPVAPNLSYPALYIKETVTTEPGMLNPRRAELNLSGFSLRVGLKFWF